MKKMDRTEGDSEGLGPDLERLLAAVPPPQAPPWFTARVLARLRSEKAAKAQKGWFGLPRFSFAIAAAVGVLLVTGILRRERPLDPTSDAAIFAGFNALVEQEADRKWWSGL